MGNFFQGLLLADYNISQMQRANSIEICVYPTYTGAGLWGRGPLPHTEFFSLQISLKIATKFNVKVHFFQK